MRPMTTHAERRPHLLIVDDEEAVAYPLSQYFRARGCQVDMATEPEEAEALVSHRRYDLAILDICLSNIRPTAGLDVLREIRRRSPGTAVIVLSGHVSAEVEREARSAGADRVLSKPMPLSELAAEVRALVGVAVG